MVGLFSTKDLHKLDLESVLDVIPTFLREMADDYSEGWGGGKMSAAAYDTAWVSMVRNPNDSELLAFEDSFNWLLTNQSEDGSWGYPPQTLLPTLAGLLALLKSPKKAEFSLHVARARTYLSGALSRWSVDKHESVGFEVLVPRLLLELGSLGVVFNFPEQRKLLDLYNEKLNIAAPKLIYSGQSNLIHSLEAFGCSVDFKRLKTLQISNGSYGNSPAATAAALIYGSEWNTDAANWLVHLSRRSSDAGEPGAMPNAHPIDVFESSWVLYNLIGSGVNLKDKAVISVLQKLQVWLQQSITPQGASISRLRGMPPDSDDTAMLLTAYNLLANEIGMKEIPVDCLQSFERNSYFACFELERGTSLSANAHVLTALLSSSIHSQWIVKNKSIDKIIDYIYSSRNSLGYWEDKWHMSPFYATARATMALMKCPYPYSLQGLKTTGEWILSTQSTIDGGWGNSNERCSTLEETAYALQTLNAVKEGAMREGFQSSTLERIYHQSVAKGVTYLLRHFNELACAKQTHDNPRLPYLWRGKELYMPWRVVCSAVFAAISQSVK
jgi:halimadienyl-diphosphate synthase